MRILLGTNVQQHSVLGKLAHDTRLVAAMKRHSITTLLTMNKPDFNRFGILTFSPTDIMSGTLPAASARRIEDEPFPDTLLYPEEIRAKLNVLGINQSDSAFDLSTRRTGAQVVDHRPESIDFAAVNDLNWL